MNARAIRKHLMRGMVGRTRAQLVVRLSTDAWAQLQACRGVMSWPKDVQWSGDERGVLAMFYVKVRLSGWEQHLRFCAALAKASRTIPMRVTQIGNRFGRML